MEPEKTDPGTARRTRKWATKTRTGCITCRRRRIKCDEAIPSCKRCISTGRDCEGYTIARDTTTTTFSSSSSSIYHQPIPSDAPAGVDASHAERGAFAMLRGDCARRVAGLFSGAFWTVDVLRAAHVYPAVWRAGLAMAAMHRATCVTAPTPAARAARQRHERFALTQSHAAVVALLALTRKPQPLADPDKEAVLLACTLFTGLCCLQEDYEQAAQHAKAGNRLYWRWKYWRRSDNDEVDEDDGDEGDGDDFTCTTRDYRADNHGARRPGCVLTTKSLTAVFTHFEMQFCSRFLSIDIPEWRWRDRAHRCSLAPFSSAADAYTELQPLLTGYCHMSRWLSVPRADAELATVGCSVAAYAREMLAWRAKFEDLLARRGTSLAALPPPPTGEGEQEDEEARHILCLRLLWMALETCFEHTEATGEMVWDDRTPAFERVTTFAETHFAARWSRRASPSSSPPGTTATTTTTTTTTTTPPNRTFTFSFAMNACEVLTWIGTNCRDGGVRRRLIALLHSWPERDGMMDARLLALVVQAVMVLEENATTGMQVPHEGCVCKLEEEDGGGGRFICADHRVCLIDTQFLGERSAAIVLTTTGMLKHGLPPYETSVSW